MFDLISMLVCTDEVKEQTIAVTTGLLLGQSAVTASCTYQGKCHVSFSVGHSDWAVFIERKNAANTAPHVNTDLNVEIS